MSDPTLALLDDLVAIDSVNPSLVPGARGEGEIARRIASECAAAGLAVHITEVAPGRPNVVAVLEGASPGPSLMLCGHLDTVGVADMEHPFTPVHRDGRIYGRGAQDMKGGLAAMIAAARALTQSGGLARGRLIVAAVVDEEHASLGAEALVSQWRADSAVVTEPTDLDIAVAHKGFEWIEVETYGVAAHGSRPLEGRDAIMHMGRVLNRLEALDASLRGQPMHPLLGTASLHASVIAGGHEWSSYPAHCTLHVERRTLPDESGDVGYQEICGVLRQLNAEDPEFSGNAVRVFGQPGYEIAPEHPLPQVLARAAGDTGCRPGRVGMSFWTDAAVLHAAGIPTVLFGPGGAGLHGPEEYVRARDVCLCRDVLVSLARQVTGQP